MYRFLVADDKSKYELSELAREFAPDSEFSFVSMEEPHFGGFDLRLEDVKDKNEAKRKLYKYLSGDRFYKPEWGILTGVRPEKLYNELKAKHGAELAAEYLRRNYYVSDEKIDLLAEISEVQDEVECSKDPKAVGLYVGIPFCPTRCSYCSFTSNKITEKGTKAYMGALLKEIDAVKGIMNSKGLYAESVYIGGGTPTALDDEDFEVLLKAVNEAYVSDKCTEFTVECGRPDTVTENKLRLVLKYGAGRISINPQSMKQHTLDLIGRSHSPEDIYKAFDLANECGIPIINTDLITGLPEEEPEDFKDSLDKILELAPENITVHTLAVKKASRLIEQDPEYAFRSAENVKIMLEYAAYALRETGYRPYYMYRQKHMAGNFENVGYCKEGSASVYNIRIMEENQSIIALGAGAISKIYYPEENRLERVPNVSNYEIYIERIDEMIKRKEEGIE